MTPMTHDEIQNLKALALAATPGPWATDDPHIVYSDIGDEITYLAKTNELDTSYKWAVKNAAFIAAANPAAILSLIAQLEARLAATPVNQQLLSALNAMMTHMGMDEDEWNKPTFDQARAAVSAAEDAKRLPPDGKMEERKSWTARQWAENVGAWENEAGHVCFGSWMAVSAMLSLLRNMLVYCATCATPSSPAVEAVSELTDEKIDQLMKLGLPNTQPSAGFRKFARAVESHVRAALIGGQNG